MSNAITYIRPTVIKTRNNGLYLKRSCLKTTKKKKRGKFKNDFTFNHSLCGHMRHLHAVRHLWTFIYTRASGRGLRRTRELARNPTILRKNVNNNGMSYYCVQR